jgi:hypothetical protein
MGRNDIIAEAKRRFEHRLDYSMYSSAFTCNTARNLPNLQLISIALS